MPLGGIIGGAAPSMGGMSGGPPPMAQVQPYGGGGAPPGGIIGNASPSMPPQSPMPMQGGTAQQMLTGALMRRPV